MKASTPLLMFIVCGLATPIALAQAPWTVTITPTMNPLPVGYCAAVHLIVRDASGTDAPRNPLGQRVTLADFDMAVATPDGISVVGQQIDASHWSVCACQGAAPATAATITATYPARSIAASARVPRASFQTTARFELSAPKGTTNPPGCPAPGIATAAAVATPASQPAQIAVAPVSPPVTITPTPAPTVAGPLAEPIPKGAVPTRTARYEPGPVTATFDLSAHGSWYEPGPVTVSLDLNARGSWYEPGPVTATFDLTATGHWIERGATPVNPLQPVPPGR